MKFLTLLKKDLRESLIPGVLATLVFSGLSFFSMRSWARQGWHDYRIPQYEPWYGPEYGIFHRYPIGEIGGQLFAASLVLGTTLGLLHFGLPRLSRTWAFLLHRPVSRSTILGSKLLATVVAFGVSLGIPWSSAYAHIPQVRATLFPPNPQVFWEGWLFIGLGLMLYLCVAQCAVSHARWYTTRLCGPVFATILIVALFAIGTISAAFQLLFLGITIFLVLLVTTFLNRDSNA